jgi:DNA-directed RNA polymerase subunit H (RpoH/RPB5)
LDEKLLWLHKLVPGHRKLEAEEAKSTLSELNVRAEQLPRILLSDPAIQAIDEEIQGGDVIEVSRSGGRAGINLAYRLVVAE